MDLALKSKLNKNHGLKKCLFWLALRELSVTLKNKMATLYDNAVKLKNITFCRLCKRSTPSDIPSYRVDIYVD